MAEQQNLTTADVANTARQTTSTAGAGGATMAPERSTPLFQDKETQEFRDRWTDIQAGFVDEPRKAVEQADALVAATMKRLAEVFADERKNLEQHWDRGGNISTEELRVALQRYRSFFTRLLSV